MNDSRRSITLCPACGAFTWGRANYCPACGASLRGTGRIELPDEDETCALCGVCGAEVPLSAGFCPNCGADRRYPFHHASEANGEDAPDAGTGTDAPIPPDPPARGVNGEPNLSGQRERRTFVSKMAVVYAPPELMGKRGASAGKVRPKKLPRRKKDDGTDPG